MFLMAMEEKEKKTVTSPEMWNYNNKKSTFKSETKIKYAIKAIERKINFFPVIRNLKINDWKRHLVRFRWRSNEGHSCL